MTTPPSFPDHSRVLHIGLPKTGTNAVQAALDNTRTELAALGVHNASQGRHDFAAAKAAAGSLEAWRRGDPNAQWLRNSRSFRESTARITILSSEAFSGAKPENIEQIVTELGGDVEVLVTLRALAPLLASWWQQRLRSREHTGLEEWVVQRIGTSPGFDSTSVLPRQNLPRIAREWGRVVGEDHVTFVIPDPQDRGSLLREFELLLGLPAGSLPVVDDGNASLPFPEAEFLRNVNRHYTAQGGDPVTWMRTVYRHATPRLKRLTAFDRHPIRVPRWVAERCNEITDDWLTAIEPLPIRIRGDVKHLYVDPGDYPDHVDVPATVSIDSAAAIAEILFSVGLSHRSGKPAARSAPPDQRLEDFATKELAAELSRRVGQRVRRGPRSG